MLSRLSVVVLVLVSACSTSAAGNPDGSAEPTQMRLGYFPNVTHATAIVGVEQGIFADALGSGVDLTAQTFNAGPEAVEAIFNGALDATYIGPNPAINAFTRSGGEAIRIVAGATSGGAALVVGDGITTPEDLAGKTLATPQLGNTQDVALRAWLAEQGYETDLEGGGEVSIVPQENGQTLESFIAGDIDGAWVPEPWATRLVTEGGGTVLVDERDLWPNGQFVTTHLIVATEFLEERPDLVQRLLTGHLEADRFVNERTDEAHKIVGTAIAELTGAELPEGVLPAAWDNLEFTVDPIAPSLTVSAENAEAMGLIDSAELDGIYELGPLNGLLAAAGEPEIQQP
jgi:NitT/TauT family transport system substrate-binding protein